MDECRKLVVYPDGFYSSGEEAQGGPRPFAVVEFCEGGIIRVEALGSGDEAQEVDIGGCLQALRELQGGGGLLEASRLFGSEEGLERLAERCRGLENLLLAAALHVARHKTMTGKSVYEALLGGGRA